MKSEGDGSPVDHRFDPYRGRVARLSRGGDVAGFAHLAVETWWEAKGPFWKGRMVNGLEVPHWHAVIRKNDGSWEYEDTVSLAPTPEEIDQELADLHEGYFDGRHGRLRMEWLDGDEAKSILNEHFRD